MAVQGHGGADDQGDDWFADVEQPGALESDPPSAEDDWLLHPEPARRGRAGAGGGPAARGGGGSPPAGGGVTPLLVAGLAAAGVFSGSSSPRTTPITSVSVET